MPAAILKVLALSGVISAGCFAVWKANNELAPTAPSATEKFSALDGEPDDTIGLGGEPIPEVPGAPQSPDQPQAAEKTEPKSPELALAEYDFAQQSEPEEPSPTRAMPAAFPSVEQAEPVLAGDLGENAEPVDTESEPGVTSLEVLDADEARQANEPTPIRTASAELGAAPNSPAMKPMPSKAGIPALLPPPNLPSPAAARSRGIDRIVPANAETIETGSGDENNSPAPESELLLEDVSSTPSRLPDIRSRGPESPRSSVSGTGIQISPNARSRGSSIPAPASESVPMSDEAQAEPVENPFPDLTTAPGQSPTDEAEPAAEEEVENPFAPRTRTSIPTPDTTPGATSIPRQPASADPEPTSLPEEPGQFNPPPGQLPARTPTINHSVGEAISPANPPRKSSIPTKGLSENLLIGEGTIDDPAITPTMQPQIRVEKRAQAEAEIGERLVYEIVVQNVGQVPAHTVVVEERIPKGTKMTRSQPQAKVGRDKILHWELGTMAAGAQKIIKVEVTPLEAGPIGSVATVRFSAQVATTTVVTAPTLSLSVEHKPEVAVGEQVPIHFVVTNTGTGTARNVKLRTLLRDPALQHPFGIDLDKKIGTLAPGKSQAVDLIVTATQDGRFAPEVKVTVGEDHNEIEQENRTLDLNVIPARLSLTREGHARRFVNRPAEFSTRVMNHSMDILKDVRITETLPVGVVPVGEMTKYRWNPTTRTVEWTVSQLGPGQYSDLKLNMVSQRAGELEGKVEAVAAGGQRAELATKLEVAGFPALKVDIHGDAKPVAVDEQVSMRVTVSNKGSAPATSVQALFELPPEMTLVGAEGPVQYTQEGKIVTFEALKSLAPNEEKQFDIVLTAAKAGSSSVEVAVYSDDRPNDPVSQEEAVTIIPK